MNEDVNKDVCSGVQACIVRKRPVYIPYIRYIRYLAGAMRIHGSQRYTVFLKYKAVYTLIYTGAKGV